MLIYVFENRRGKALEIKLLGNDTFIADNPKTWGFVSIRTDGKTLNNFETFNEIKEKAKAMGYKLSHTKEEEEIKNEINRSSKKGRRVRKSSITKRTKKNIRH